MTWITTLLGSFVLVFAGTTSAASANVGGFSAGDLPRILGSSPAVKGVAFVVSPGEDALCGVSSSFGLQDLRRADPSDCPKTFVDKMTRFGFQRGLLKGWTAPRPVLTNAYAFGYTFRTAQGAHAGLRLFTSGLKSAKGLGVEAFTFVHARDGAEYLWRIGNLVLGVEIDCPDGPCSFDVTQAARRYADAINNQAQKK